MRIAAFDLGSTMAVALTGQPPEHKYFTGERHQRARDTWAWLDAMMAGWVEFDKGVGLVIYERPFARGQHATRALWGLAGILEAVSLYYGHPILDATPADIKKFAAGKGDADKDDMQAAAFLLGYTGDNEHEADAFCLLKYAEAKVAPELDKPKRKRKKE